MVIFNENIYFCCQKISAKQKTNALIALVLLLCIMFFWLKEI